MRASIGAFAAARFVLVWRRAAEGERKCHSQTGSKLGPDSYVGPDRFSLAAPLDLVKTVTLLV